jgi:MEMO1 family protein
MKVVKELKDTGKFTTMSVSQDEDEHSLEMHLPYIYAILAKSHPDTMPLLVPIMVGATSESKEKEYGKLFAPYLQNQENLFVISSDFCHW